LREISEEAIIPPVQPRRRSNSLPIPQIEISLYQGPTSTNRDSPSGSSTTKDYIEVPEPPITSLLTGKFCTWFDWTEYFVPITILYIIRAENPLTADELGSAVNAAAGGSSSRRGSEKKRRVKMADLRAFVETRMFSKSDRALEHVGLDATNNGKRLEHAVNIINFNFN